jgi:DNA-3-methyladenine glycosylase II
MKAARNRRREHRAEDGERDRQRREAGIGREHLPREPAEDEMHRHLRAEQRLRRDEDADVAAGAGVVVSGLGGSVIPALLRLERPGRGKGRQGLPFTLAALLEGAHMVGRIIETLEDVEEGAAWLAAREPRFAEALALTGPLPLRRRPDGFAALLGCDREPAGLGSGRERDLGHGSRRRARPIRRRWSLMPDEALRACGLSRQKIAYARGAGGERRRLRGPAGAADRRGGRTLVEVKGIGVWTAEIYAMFSLGRADVFAPGDLALQDATRLLFGSTRGRRRRRCGRWPRRGRRGGRLPPGCSGPITGSRKEREGVR